MSGLFYFVSWVIGDEVFTKHPRLVGTAHGTALFDLQLPNGISGKGPKMGLRGTDFQKLVGALTVLKYILNQISSNRANDLQGELDKLYASFKKNRKELINILENNSGIDF